MMVLPELTREEIERYARHIVLRDVGGAGQRKLKAAKRLRRRRRRAGRAAAALSRGGGRRRDPKIIDDDIVAASNLQRQVLFGEADLGRPKTQAAAEAVARLNPHVRVVGHDVRLTADNVRGLIEGCDVIADGSDNFDTRYIVSDACFHAKKPLVTAAVGQFDGSLTTLRPFETGPDGLPNPTYRCLFPQKPPPGSLPTCAEAGVLGALTGMVGSLMALEVIREIVGFGESMVGRLALFDLATMRFETLSYGWDEDNPLNGTPARPRTDIVRALQFAPTKRPPAQGGRHERRDAELTRAGRPRQSRGQRIKSVATTAISTLYSGATSLASIVARAGVSPSTTHASHAAFISGKVEMSAR